MMREITRKRLGQVLLCLLVSMTVVIVGCQSEVPVEPTVTPTAIPTPIPTQMPNALFVNATQQLGDINPYVYGTNFGPWITVPFDLIPQAENAGIRFLRFPGGNWGDLNKITHRQVDQFIKLCEQMGAEPQISVRLRGGTPEQAVELVTYANIEKEYGVKYWSIGNEPSLYDDYDTNRYNEEWRQFAEAMLAVDPDILLIGPDTHQYTGGPDVDPKDENGRDWVQAFLEANGDMVDIVAVHRYPFPRTMTSVTTIPELRASSSEWDTIIPNLKTLINETTGRDLPVAITEVNSHWSKVISQEATPDSHFNAIWWGDVLGRMIEQEVDIVAHFVLQTKDGAGGWGLLARDHVRPTYYVYQLYQQFGQIRLTSASDVPNVSVYAAEREDGTITVIVINLGDADMDVPLQIVGDVGETAVIHRLDPAHNAENLGEISFKNTDAITLPGQSISLYLFETE
ncbi:MAG: hypothetical protein DWQ04_03815 [Chloroflexi bacterium]|nr:MAG: hypothetical protein DWQ04_03815 [Chloroflexota bacterium]